MKQYGSTHSLSMKSLVPKPLWPNPNQVPMSSRTQLRKPKKNPKISIKLAYFKKNQLFKDLFKINFNFFGGWGVPLTLKFQKKVFLTKWSSLRKDNQKFFVLTCCTIFNMRSSTSVRRHKELNKYPYESSLKSPSNSPLKTFLKTLWSTPQIPSWITPLKYQLWQEDVEAVPELKRNRIYYYLLFMWTVLYLD